MTAPRTSAPRLFVLDRRADPSGVSGTGIVADGVEWPDGTCAVRWRTEHKSTTVYDSIAAVHAIHGHGGCTLVRFPATEHPFDRGRSDAQQDAMENAPFASIGGLSKRAVPEVPGYIESADRDAWLAGYISECRAMHGDDWRTCSFAWKPALTIPAAAPAPPPPPAPTPTTNGQSGGARLDLVAWIVATCVVGAAIGAVLLGCPRLPPVSGCAPTSQACHNGRPVVCSASQRWEPVGDLACSAVGGACVVNDAGVAHCAPAPASATDGGAL